MPNDLKATTEKLAVPFPREAIKQREGGRGKRLDYVEGHTVIHRLIDATDNQFDVRIVNIEERRMGDSALLIATVELTIPGLGTRQHMGVQMVHDRGGEDLVKGAVTDALKKAATLFGVGLELYGPDYEAGEVAPQPQRPQPRQAPPPQRPGGNGTPPEASNAEPPITTQQMGQLFALAGEIAEQHAWPKDWVKDDLYQFFNVTSTKDLTRTQGARTIRALYAVKDKGAPFVDALQQSKA